MGIASFKKECLASGAETEFCDMYRPGKLEHLIAACSVPVKWSVYINDREPVVYMTHPPHPTWDWRPGGEPFTRLRVRGLNLENSESADAYLTVEGDSVDALGSDSPRTFPICTCVCTCPAEDRPPCRVHRYA